MVIEGGRVRGKYECSPIRWIIQGRGHILVTRSGTDPDAKIIASLGIKRIMIGSLQLIVQELARKYP